MQYISFFHAIEAQFQKKAKGLELLLAAEPRGKIQSLLKQAQELNIPVQKVSKAYLDSLQENRGILLKLSVDQSGAEAELEDFFLLPQERPYPLLFALDSISDPHNLGAIMRSADIFELDGLIIPKRRSVQTGETVTRVAVGADNWVKTASVTNMVRSLNSLKDEGFWVLGADMNGIPIDTLDAKRPIVIVMGSEGKGLGRFVGETCDQIVSIPQGGHVDSLNVSVAAGILMYELRRQQQYFKR